MPGKQPQEAIRIRMYRVGLGDCFLVTLPGTAGPHHVLMDCGVHSKGDAKTIGKAVEDVAAQTGGKIDIVVATHAHQDHISGFGAFAARFRQFQVKEVWMPWTEDPSDSGAAALKRKQAAAVSRLTQHFAAAADPKFDAARAALVLLAGNQPALELLKGGFAGATVRYLEAGKQLQAPAGITGLAAQILGPPRDPAFLARMDPPAGQRYLALKNGRAREMSGLQPFPKKWRAGARGLIRLNPKDLNYLHEIASACNHGLAFALDQAINNTSVVALLTYRGKHLLFPGDAQYGNWQNWLQGDASKSLLADVDFYKVSHHGSLNATPKGALEGMAAGRLAAMVSTQSQPWPSIPYGNLMDALERQTGNKVVRSDSLPIAGAPKGPALTKLPQGFTQGAFWYDYTIPLG